METSVPADVKSSGLSNVVNTIAAPSEAFERLSVAPTWGWALVVALVLVVIGAYLQGPASRHAAVAQTQKMVATSSLFANFTAEQKQRAIENAGKPSVFTYIGPVVAIFLAVFFNTLLLLIGNAIGRGQADFKRLWAASMNIAVPTLGLGAIVLGIILMVRGPDSFNGTADLVRAMPSLSWVIPHTSVVLGAFLSGISIFSLWGFFLNATALRTMSKTSSGVAYGFAAAILLITALVPAAFVSIAQSFKVM